MNIVRSSEFGRREAEQICIETGSLLDIFCQAQYSAYSLYAVVFFVLGSR